MGKIKFFTQMGCTNLGSGTGRRVLSKIPFTLGSRYEQKRCLGEESITALAAVLPSCEAVRLLRGRSERETTGELCQKGSRRRRAKDNYHCTYIAEAQSASAARRHAHSKYFLRDGRRIFQLQNASLAPK
jgi:hypothetical protein